MDPTSEANDQPGEPSPEDACMVCGHHRDVHADGDCEACGCEYHWEYDPIEYARSAHGLDDW